MKFFIAIASAIAAKNACEERGNFEMSREWDDYISDAIKLHAPSGSGFDRGTTLNTDASAIGGRKPQRLVFDTAFHHMTEHGMYDGWTEHQVWVYPWFDGFDIRITGRNRNDIKDYIGDVFHALSQNNVMTLADWRNSKAGV